jgi:hypothetical protein
VWLAKLVISSLSLPLSSLCVENVAEAGGRREGEGPYKTTEKKL